MYRIVHNEQTGSFRVEKRGWLGWAFVSDPQSGDYVGFESLETARNWIRNKLDQLNTKARRWKIVADCNA